MSRVTCRFTALAHPVYRTPFIKFATATIEKSMCSFGRSDSHPAFASESVQLVERSTMYSSWLESELHNDTAPCGDTANSHHARVLLFGFSRGMCRARLALHCASFTTRFVIGGRALVVPIFHHTQTLTAIVPVPYRQFTDPRILESPNRAASIPGLSARAADLNCTFRLSFSVFDSVSQRPDERSRTGPPQASSCTFSNACQHPAFPGSGSARSRECGERLR